jgi:hypothetical protein
MNIYRLILLSMVLFLAGCEYELPVKGLDPSPKIYLYSVPQPGEPLEVYAAVAIPHQKGYNDFDPGKVHVEVTVNGKEVELSVDESYEPEYPSMERYVSDVELKAGDVVEVAAVAENADPVTSRTTVPEVMDTYAVTTQKTSTDKGYPSSSTGDVRSCRSIVVDVPSSDKDGYYGLRVRCTEIDMEEPENATSEYLDPLVWDTEYFISSREYDMWVEYDEGYLQVYKVKSGNEGKLEIQVKYDYVDSHRKIFYTVEIFRLSPEFWRYCRAAFIDYARVEIMDLFMYPSKLYTDIDGGLGLLGAVNRVEVEIEGF